ncbi:hypothetical protein NDU88_007894, partial [Pleurodeles waltl]
HDSAIKDSIGPHPHITYRKTQSLGDHLTRSLFSSKDNSSWLTKKSLGFWQCGHCKSCLYAQNTHTYTTFEGKICDIADRITCETEYVVYVIECGCHKKY